MPLISRKQLFSLVLFAALACDGGPSSLSTGNLSISVLGLPAGSSAAVTVTGPDSYSQSVSGTQTLSQLVSGTYTVAASSVTVGSTVYSASPASQSVIVAASTANASIYYASGAGSLALTINGLGTNGTAAVTVTGPNAYTQSVASTRTFTGLTPGSYTVTARDTTATGGTLHTAAPTTQNVTVTATATANATVTYTPPSGGPLNLRIAGLYITQSAQKYGGTVPLVKNRNGYLRVFVIANSTNTAAPDVRVRFYNGGPVDSTLILPQGLSVPTAVDESSLSYTWNVPVSGTLIQPGLSIQAEVDPGNVILESDETDNLFPAVGQLGTDIRTVPALRVTFVPILQTASGLQGNVTPGNKDAFLDMTKRMQPIDSVDAVVGVPYSTTWTLQANGDGWAELLGEFDAAMAADGRYYYGVAKVSYSSGVAGVAYVSNGSANAYAALGWDYLTNGSGSVVAAHELAHNWGRNHAPCGGPTGVDPSYPQPDGSIGSYGLDVTTQTLKASSLSDIMGYCDPKWISDYSYQGVLDYRIAHPLVMSAEAGQPVQPSLLVWGHIRDGELVLEPSFQVNARPRLPVHPGPYSIEARAEDGTTLFALSFAPNEVADVPGRQQNFAFAIPLSAAKAARLSSLRLAGRGREAISTARVSSAAQVQAGVQSDSVEVRRVGAGRVALRWNAGAHPMVMVRDAETGQVLSFARGGAVELSISKRQVDLVLSNGLKSRSRRVRVGQ